MIDLKSTTDSEIFWTSVEHIVKSYGYKFNTRKQLISLCAKCLYRDRRYWISTFDPREVLGYEKSAWNDTLKLVIKLNKELRFSMKDEYEAMTDDEKGKAIIESFSREVAGRFLAAKLLRRAVSGPSDLWFTQEELMEAARMLDSEDHKEYLKDRAGFMIQIGSYIERIEEAEWKEGVDWLREIQKQTNQDNKVG